MWAAIGRFVTAWFGWATPQRADFEFVAKLHEDLSKRLHAEISHLYNELNSRCERIDELEKREQEQATEIRILKERVDAVTKLQTDCERHRENDRVMVEGLRDEIRKLKGAS